MSLSLSVSLSIFRLDRTRIRAQALPSGRTITDPEERELIQYCGISTFNNKVPYDPFIHLLAFEDPEVDVLAQTMRNAIRREMLESSKREDANSAL